MASNMSSISSGFWTSTLIGCEDHMESPCKADFQLVDTTVSRWNKNKTEKDQNELVFHNPSFNCFFDHWYNFSESMINLTDTFPRLLIRLIPQSSKIFNGCFSIVIDVHRSFFSKIDFLFHNNPYAEIKTKQKKIKTNLCSTTHLLTASSTIDTIFRNQWSI